jgi:hypothetical protein
MVATGLSGRMLLLSLCLVHSSASCEWPFCIGSTHFASFFVHPAFSRISDALSSGSASGQNLDQLKAPLL